MQYWILTSEIKGKLGSEMASTEKQLLLLSLNICRI